jgi:hypothetical protein
MKEGQDSLGWLQIQLLINKPAFKSKILSIDAFYDELQSFSFVDESSLLILPQAEKIKKKDVPLITESTKWMILLASSMRTTNPLYQFFESKNALLDFSLQTKAVQETRVLEELGLIAAYYDKKIALNPRKFMLERLGYDWLLFNQEIMKIATFIGSREEITLDDVKEVCLDVKEKGLFDLTEALFMKKTDLALKVARLILNESTSLFPLLRGLRNQLQVELQVACLLNESSSALQEIQNLFPYMKGKILQNHVQIAQNFGLSNLKKAIMIVDEIDFLAKSGSVDEDLLLDMLIAKVTYV